MRCALVLLLIFAMCSLAMAQDHAAHQPVKPATLNVQLWRPTSPGLDQQPEAQQFFDQGLRQPGRGDH
jgi:hypothetical protein